jgi:polysaccharide pyruvyl transferase WcaK-like protein
VFAGWRGERQLRLIGTFEPQRFRTCDVMKQFTIEIQGTGTHNRGAELMAAAIAQQLRVSFPGVRLVVSPMFGEFDARARYQLWTTWEFPGRFRSTMSSVALRASSPVVRRWMGVVNPKEVDVVLDASGFAFADQWGRRAATAVLRKMESMGRRRQPLVLLPQALGPFSDCKVTEACRQLFERASLVCARDRASYEAALPLCGARKLRQYPDFTAALAPASVDGIPLPHRFVAIVPNYRMLDKTSTGGAYLMFVERLIRLLQQKGHRPVFILHDDHEDRRVIELITGGHDIPIIAHDDPLVLKGLLGRAQFVVGSRFHALVAALSQGVPCIGVGWSHKYPELFHEFDASALFLPDLADDFKLEELVTALTIDDQLDAWSKRISNRAATVKDQIDHMWTEIVQLLRGVPGAAKSAT